MRVDGMNKNQLWQEALAELELSLSKANFTTWFKQTFILEFKEHQVVVGVPSAFAKAWLENKYHDKIFNALQHITNYAITQVDYRVTSDKPDASLVARFEETQTSFTNPSISPQQLAPARVKLHSSPPPPPRPALLKGLNPKYTFENFVIGKRNELARAAAIAVAERPGQVYNPLFIYGGVGLGKTHLTQAIGITILGRDPNKKVLYVSCETFTNEFIQAIAQGRSADFKHKYRSIDLLLIDDIQFLAGKEGTQEEFFHTFNFLHQSDKQIVLSSDRPPKAIPTLEHRLTSRFEWGMIVDIGVPDLETRIAILNSKCKEKGVQIGGEILTYIANVVQDNIRELEGALNRVIASSALANIPPTLADTKQTLSGMSSRPQRQAMTGKQILQAVCQYYDIAPQELIGIGRKRELVTPRQIAMYLMREDMSSSFPAIGDEFGGRDHTTAMHACEKIREEAQREGKIRDDIAIIRQRLLHLTSAV